MADIVERARDASCNGFVGHILTECADEIERLRAALKKYANPNNWTGCGRTSVAFDTEFCPQGLFGDGWAIAESALQPRALQEQPS